MAKSINILVVEDTPEKFARVNMLLRDRLKDLDVSFALAKNYNEAFKALQVSVFDVVILDLLIPLSGGAASAENSRALLEMMLTGDVLPAAHVIGLTEFKQVAREERSYYFSNLFALEVFSWTSNVWADRLADKIRYLLRSKNASLRYTINNFESDALIMIARYENEFKPIMRKMKWASPPKIGHSYFPSHECASGRLLVRPDLSLKTTSLCIGEMGSPAATALTTQAINVFRPQLVCMLGMCCGFNSPKSASPALFGDVIVATATASWEEGRYMELDDGSRFFRNRGVPKTVDKIIGPVIQSCVEAASDRLLPLCQQYLKSGIVGELRKEYTDRIRATPDFKMGMIVSGSSVIADEEKILEIISRQPGALGLDMEIFGLFTAAEKAVGKSPSAFAIKGVADFGTKGKHKKIQATASILSYYTFAGIARALFGDGHLIPV